VPEISAGIPTSLKAARFPPNPDVHGRERNVRFTCAPGEGGAFQWVQAPPGDRSSRKQPEQSWR
jgi:hypothetical protein